MKKIQPTEHKNEKFPPAEAEGNIPGWKLWLKRIGIGGLLFFTVKGIIWLFVFYFAGSSLNACITG